MDVKTTDNYMSNNSLRVRHIRSTQRLSRDHESPKYSIDFKCILQIQSETQQTLSEAHADVKTTDNYMLRMFAIGFTKKRQTKTTSQNRVKNSLAKEEQKIRFKFKVRLKIVGSV